MRADANPVPIATLPTPAGRDFCAMGNFGPHNLHENRPGSFVSEETIFATYHDAGVRVFDIRDAYAPREIASWIPPLPAKMLDPRPNVTRSALTCDCFVTTRRAHVRHGLERRIARFAVRRLASARSCAAAAASATRYDAARELHVVAMIFE